MHNEIENKAEETCRCGAVLNITTRWGSDLEKPLKQFRDAHLECRETTGTSGAQKADDIKES